MAASNNVVAIVPVRVGSKGLPGKNITPIAGIPLYLHAINQGLRTAGRVLLSSDIPEIDDAGLPNGCTLCPRPVQLATDDTPIEAVIHHLIDDYGLAGKTLLLLQATSPLRLDIDIIAVLELFGRGDYYLVLSVTERDRSVLKFGTIENNCFVPLRSHHYCFCNRQQLPPVYGPNGAVYVFSADRFVSVGGFPSGRIGAVEMPADRSVDIDTLADMRMAEAMFRDQSLMQSHLSM